MEHDLQWEKLKEQLPAFVDCNLAEMIISNPLKKQDITKIKIRPVLLKQELVFQASTFKGKQVFHENLKKEEVVRKCFEWLKHDFGQMEVKHERATLICLSNKKGTLTIKEKKAMEQEGKGDTTKKMLSHNREKKYILKEGVPVGFLIDLGVQTSQGKIVHSAYDKYRQINRFLEFVEDVMPVLEKNEVIRILDFDCGKSYLTFALYHYLHELKHKEVQIIGLDLKEDVITHCNALAEKYSYENLKFLTGDIKDYTGQDEVDMVVTLHACDTATDYALYKAIKWNASVILSVPCCHHEVNRQIKNDVLQPMLNHGIIKDRMAALVTDSLRALILEEQGYETQLLEFIDMTHTPKNILIRAVKHNKMMSEHKKHKLKEQKKELTEFLGIHTTLQKLMKE